MKRFAPLLLVAAIGVAASGCTVLRGFEVMVTGKSDYTDMAEGKSHAGAAEIVKRECKLPVDGVRKPFVDGVNEVLRNDPEAVGPAGGHYQVHGLDCAGDGKSDIPPAPTPLN